tara:strand:- start:157 stop:486 length:330 start_codon:yes stop_codon:yes gene_type:complete
MAGSFYQNFKNEVPLNKNSILDGFKHFNIQMILSDDNHFVFSLSNNAEENPDYMQAIYNLVALVSIVQEVDPPKNINVSSFNMVREDFVTPINPEIVNNGDNVAKKHKP